MNINKNTVFISYCHIDFANDDISRLEYIVNLFIQESDSNYEVIWDGSHLESGDDIDDFMIEAAEKCDAAILLLSPTYKEKVENRNEGVFKEFNILYSRHLSLKERNNKLKLLYPILISGTPQNSVPKEVEKIKHEDLSKLYIRYISQSKTIQIPHQVEKKTEEVVQKINQAILANLVVKSVDFQNRTKELLIKFFKETKSEWYKEENFHLLENLIVKTRPLQAIRENKSQFLIGRKGSGKSTIVDVLPFIKKAEISFNIPINLDNFQLDRVYAIFYSSPELFQGQNVVISKLKAFKYIWDIFLHLSVLVRISLFANRINDRRIHRIIQFLFEEYELDITTLDVNESKIYSDLYYTSFDLLISYISHCNKIAQKSKNSSLSLSRQISLNNFRSFCIPDEFVIEKFADILMRIDKKPLITLDGYDTESDEFIKDGYYIGDSKLRLEFQRLWLHSLMLLILDKGIKGETEDYFYNQFLYCITIPKDRFYSIRNDDRDAYRQRGKFILVRWTGIELSILVRKRLEEITGWQTDNKNTPKERLFAILKNKYPELNTSIEIEFESQTYNQDIFCYVLRHTFWRPRDILFIFGMLITAIDDRIVRNIKLDSSYIKTIVREASSDIIEREFINEFKTIYKNFEEVIYAFWKSQQFLTYEKIYQILNNLDLEAHDRIINLNDINKKLEFLFEVGFIGVHVPNDLKIHFQTHDFAFNFNESNFLKEKVKRPDYNKTIFVIHPMFRDYLRLEIDKKKSPVLLFDWDYLKKNENINHYLKII